MKLGLAQFKYIQIRQRGIYVFPLKNLENISRCKLACAQKEIELSHLNAPLAIMKRGSKGAKMGGEYGLGFVDPAEPKKT